jgi:hypothetical protein
MGGLPGIRVLAGGDGIMTGRLHGVRHPGEVSAGQALAWFTGSAGQVIGYLLAADRAEWFRCQGPLPHGPEAARNLTAAFEVVATDGERHLRWWHAMDSRGHAVGLAEDPGLLPPGTGLPAQPGRTRLDGVATRLLAGLTAGPGRVGHAYLGPVGAMPGSGDRRGRSGGVG